MMNGIEEEEAVAMDLFKTEVSYGLRAQWHVAV